MPRVRQMYRLLNFVMHCGPCADPTRTLPDVLHLRTLEIIVHLGPADIEDSGDEEEDADFIPYDADGAIAYYSKFCDRYMKRFVNNIISTGLLYGNTLLVQFELCAIQGTRLVTDQASIT